VSGRCAHCASDLQRLSSPLLQPLWGGDIIYMILSITSQDVAPLVTAHLGYGGGLGHFTLERE
jgi:hypothetical protein